MSSGAYYFDLARTDKLMKILAEYRVRMIKTALGETHFHLPDESQFEALAAALKAAFPEYRVEKIEKETP